MYNDLTYNAWLTQGNKYKEKYYRLQSIGLMFWAGITALCVMGFHIPLLSSMVLGFVPYFLFYLGAMSYYEKWQGCEDKYNHHVPFIDVQKLNVALAALEFEENAVIAHFLRHDNTLESLRIPSEKVRLLPAEDDVDSMKMRRDINNFTHTEEWVYADIYLTPKMQKKLVALLVQ